MSLLLDTHILIWFVAGAGLTDAVVGRIRSAARQSEAVVSVATAWEIGTLVRKNKIDLDAEPRLWFSDSVQSRGLSLVPITTDIAFDSSSLPESFHADPVDRLLVATARRHDMILATRDRQILTYAEAGHVQVLAC